MMPVSDAKAWKKEIETRALRKEITTGEELRGMKPDWLGEFVECDKQLDAQEITSEKAL